MNERVKKGRSFYAEKKFASVDSIWVAALSYSFRWQP